MGYNARNDEIRDNVTRMRREWEAQRDDRWRLSAASMRALGQRLFVFLAEDRFCANFKASLAGHQLRQLWDRGGFRLARKAA